jgi:DNA-binding GntR family transcriptional regulator
VKNLKYLYLCNVVNKYQYQAIYAQLKAEIQAGHYAVGSLLPSENDLCKTFQMSRMTIRQALAELVKEGYIVRKHGKGSIVKANTSKIGLLTFKGFSEVVADAKTIILKEPSLSDWPTDFSFPVTLKQSKKGCIKLERIRLKGQEPLMVEITYLPNTFKKIITETLVDGSLFKSLKTWYKIEAINLEQSISAIEANLAIAQLLNIEVGKPLIYIERKYLTNDPNIFIYSTLYCYTGLYTLFTDT